jgi:acyl-CoA thioesterase
MSRAESIANPATIASELDDQRLALLESWARMLARRPTGRPDGSQSSGPLTDALNIRRVSMTDGRAVYELEVLPELMNPNGVLAGPAVYAMVDYSMGAALVSTLDAGQYSATIQINISYFAAVREGKLRAETEVIRRGGRIAFLDSKVRDQAGKLIAAATGSFMIVSDGK